MSALPAGQPLRLNAGLKDLKDIRNFVRMAALKQKLDAQTTYDLLLATTEAVTNILVHGYAGNQGWLEVEVRIDGDAFEVALRDCARQFDPTLFPFPDLSVPLEQRPLGGMGVYLMRELTDSIIYQPLPQGGNELVLIKKIVVHQ